MPESSDNRRVKLNGYMKPILTILFSGLLALIGSMVTIGQYKERVDTTETAVKNLDTNRVKPAEDRLAKLETQGAVREEKIANMSQQMKEGFTDIKQLILEMKKELKEEIKEKRAK